MISPEQSLLRSVQRLVSPPRVGCRFLGDVNGIQVVVIVVFLVVIFIVIILIIIVIVIVIGIVIVIKIPIKGVTSDIIGRRWVSVGSPCCSRSTL